MTELHGDKSFHCLVLHLVPGSGLSTSYAHSYLILITAVSTHYCCSHFKAKEVEAVLPPQGISARKVKSRRLNLAGISLIPDRHTPPASNWLCGGRLKSTAHSLLFQREPAFPSWRPEERDHLFRYSCQTLPGFTFLFSFFPTWSHCRKLFHKM